MISRSTFRVLLAALAFLVLPITAAAQGRVADEAADARLHVGPLALEPRLAVRNVGMDTNVFNDSTGPTRDFTATFGPELDSWLRIGRLNLSGTSALAWNYYRKASSERSFDFSQEGRAELDLGRIVPHLDGAIERSRQRPNLEIDARVERELVSAGGGVSLVIGPNLSVDLEHEERTLDYGDAGLAGISFGTELNRRETETRATAHLVLTPLTTFVLKGAARRDRFDRSELRDSDSVLVMPGIVFKPLALISGEAHVGVRSFTPRSSDLPGFRGVVSDVSLSYLVRDMTRFTALVERDVDYSFEVTQPYYVSTGVRLSVVQALGASWDVVGHAGRTGLAYRSSLATVSDPNRTDRVSVYGIGLGRRLGTDVRVGVDLERAARTSTEESRAYEGLRGGGSVTYGF